jgi:hypothetical protein
MTPCQLLACVHEASIGTCHLFCVCCCVRVGALQPLRPPPFLPCLHLVPVHILTCLLLCALEPIKATVIGILSASLDASSNAQVS